MTVDEQIELFFRKPTEAPALGTLGSSWEGTHEQAYKRERICGRGYHRRTSICAPTLQRVAGNPCSSNHVSCGGGKTTH